MLSQWRHPNFARLLLLAWLLPPANLVALYWGGTVETLLGTDDAMRLVQARAFLPLAALISACVLGGEAAPRAISAS
jgi:hypothetical protein